MNLKILSNQLSKIYNTVGNEWLTRNFKTEPYDFKTFVKRGDIDDTVDYIVEVYTHDLIPKDFEYRDEIANEKKTKSANHTILTNKLKELIKYIIPTTDDLKNTFSVKLMDLHPHAYGATTANEKNETDIIKESNLDSVIMNYLNELFQVNDIHYHFPIDHNEEDEEYEDENRVNYFIGDYEDGDNDIFKWYSCDYFNEGSHARTICPTVDLETKYSSILNGYFGDRWIEPFKSWFEKNFGDPVKTVEWWGKE